MLTTRNRTAPAIRLPDRAGELRKELARKIALFIGSAEIRATDVAGLTLHRRTAPTAPCPATYEPGVTVIAQGRKRVELGRNTFIYDASRFLLTSIDLPVVSRVIEASEKVPCLAMALKLEMSVVRELTSREEIRVAGAPCDSPAMATGETTVEFQRQATFRRTREEILPRASAHAAGSWTCSSTHRTFPFSPA